MSQIVGQDSTTTTLISSVNPSLFGQSVTFTATVSVVAPGVGTPTGTVTFKDGATTLGTGTLAAGVATFSTATLTAGAHSITAVYGGDTNNATSTSAVLTQTVNQTGTSTTLASSVNPSLSGQSVTFTATVLSSGSVTPTGTVTFKDGATTIGSGTLNGSGVATFATTTLTVAQHSITAVYGGDGNNTGSTSTALTQTVQQNTTTTLTSSLNPSTAGVSVTFTATVAGTVNGAPTPTGTVTFKDGATTIGTGTLNGSGVATFATVSLTPGAHSITAVYGGATLDITSTSAVLTQTVIQTTTTTLTSSANPATFGSPVTFTATVTAGSGTPTGTVTFKDGTTTIGTGTLNGSGVATFTTSSLAVGAHSITAVYGGDANNSPSTSAVLTETIQESSTTTLTSSANPSLSGAPVTFTATVTGSSGTPTGTVTFKDGGTTLGTGTLNGSGVATFSTATLAVGSHMITAAYGGDANNLPSTSAVLTQVVQQNTTTALTSSTNPAFSGGSVTFTAVVKGLVSGTPTGTVTFKDGTTALGTNTLNGSGTATFITTSLSVGSHSITAVYGGDTLDVGSTSLAVSETINPADFSVTASPTSATITPGQTATYTFTITPDGSYTSPINFSCTGLPAFSSCSFSTNPVTPDAQTVTTTLTITTMGPNSAIISVPASHGGPGNTPAYALGTSAALMSLLGMMLLGGDMKRKRQLCKGLLIASAMLVVMGAMSACASNPGGNKNVTPAGTSTITVTAAGGGSTSHNVSVTLVVQ